MSLPLGFQAGVRGEIEDVHAWYEIQQRARPAAAGGVNRCRAAGESVRLSS